MQNNLNTNEFTSYLPDHLKWVKPIYLTLSGSRSYGTSVGDSDYDYRGFCIPPKEYYFSPFKSFDQVEVKSPDITIFEISKFIKLAANSNPNVLETLFVDSSSIMHCDSLGEKILANRDLFLSKKLKSTIVGYVNDQLKKLQHDKVSSDKQTLTKASVKRKLDIEKHGYCTKNAYHIVRLLNECVEFLATGKLVVMRPERNLLLEIRRGEHSYDWLMEYIDKSLWNIKLLAESSKLPEDVNHDKIEKLCSEVIDTYLSKYSFYNIKKRFTNV